MDKGYTYHEAKKNCMDMAAVLVTIANKDLMEFLYCKFSSLVMLIFHFFYSFKSDHRSFAINNSNINAVISFSANFRLKHPFWIGLSKGENGWKWPDGTILRYQLWGKNEPKKMHSCVLAESEQKGGYWYTTDCNNTNFRSDIVGYVCQQ